MTASTLASLPPAVDLLIIGGGITGAGIFREAARSGVSVVLVEARDFASGTSSWSSKLVHGGLRYLQTGEWRLTRESVQERQRLLAEAPGLVEPLDFLMPQFAGAKPGRHLVRMGLRLYDLFSQRGARSQVLSAAQTLERQPQIRREGLLVGLQYRDARTDDCRLVWRLIEQGMADGGRALHYTAARSLLREQGRVIGAALAEADPAQPSDVRHELRAKVVINATGVWSGDLAADGDGTPALRPLRGSHLVFPRAKLPLDCAVSWFHPRDRRGVFLTPWQGATLLGTTDLDHGEDLWNPRMTPAEVEYLIEGLRAALPGANVSAADAISAFAGVRPIVATGAGKPSSASRESTLWTQPGLVGVTGGKLTTFRVTARQVLRAAQAQCPALKLAPEAAPLFDTGRTQGDAPDAAPAASQVQARASECIRHLDDLLLRRTRAGLALPDHGEVLIEPALAACRAQLGWDDAHCAAEAARYRTLVRAQHGVPV